MDFTLSTLIACAMDVGNGHIVFRLFCHISPNEPHVSPFSCRSAGDNPKSACQREAEEELGVHLDQGELVHVFSTKHQFVLRNGTYIDNEFVEVFVLARDLDLSKVKLQEEEVEEVKWMHWREVERCIKDPTAGFVTAHTHYEPFWEYMGTHYPGSGQTEH